MRRISSPLPIFVFFLTAGCFFNLGCRKAERQPQPVEPGLVDTLTDFLTNYNPDPQAVHQFQDKAGGFHIKIELGLGAYEAIEPQLEKRLADASAVILKKEKSREKDALYFLLH